MRGPRHCSADHWPSGRRRSVPTIPKSQLRAIISRGSRSCGRAVLDAHRLHCAKRLRRERACNGPRSTMRKRATRGMFKHGQAGHPMRTACGERRPAAARPSLVSPRLQALPVRYGSGRTTHSACASPRVGTCKGRGARQPEPAACVDRQRTIHAKHGLLVFDIAFNRPDPGDDATPRTQQSLRRTGLAAGRSLMSGKNTGNTVEVL
jgi:hypothetical protein